MIETLQRHSNTKTQYQPLVTTLEDDGWYATLTLLTTDVHGTIHNDNISNVFKQCYIPLMPTNAYMQQIHLLAIKYLKLLMLNKRQFKNHQIHIIITEIYSHIVTHPPNKPPKKKIPQQIAQTNSSCLVIRNSHWPNESNITHLDTNKKLFGNVTPTFVIPLLTHKP